VTYFGGGMLKSFKRPGGGVSTFEYDERGRLKKDTGPDGRSSTLTVTPIRGGNVVTVETTLGRKTTYRTQLGDDGVNRRTVTEPGGAVTTSFTNEEGEAVTETADGTTRTTVLAPDPRWGMIAPVAAKVTVRTPGGKTTTVTRSRAVELADPLNVFSVKKVTEKTTIGGRTSTSTITPPAAGGPQEWVAKATTASGRELTRVFDAKLRVLRDQAKGRAASRYAYDDRGRLRSVTRGEGADERTATIDFNERDEFDTITNQLGDAATYTYDDAGRPKTRKAFDGASTTAFGHNADGATTSVTPPGRTAFTRDVQADGLLHGETAPVVGNQGNQSSYTYDKDARVKVQTLPGGRKIEHTYDAASGHETELKLARGTIATDTDHTTGRVQSITAPGGVKLDYGYDGGIELETALSGPVDGSIEREVDDELRTSQVTVNGADPIAMGYDEDGALKSAGDVTLGYAADSGALTSLTMGALAETWAYDAFGAAESMAVKRSGATVFGLTFERDDADRITKKTETIGGETHVYEYTYDKLGRLQTVKRDGTQTADPEYGANGNRTDGATEHDAQDRPTKRGSATYAYNAEGQRISRTAPSGTTGYRYDELGNLLGVDLPGGKTIDYVLDGRGRRVGKQVDGQRVSGLLWEGQLRPTASLDASGDVVNRFVYGARSNVPDELLRGGKKYRLITDNLGSVRLVVEAATGDVAQRLDYDEWGRVTADSNPGFQPFGFAGGLYDHETGLVRFGMRDYDAETGRWMTKDPSGFAGGDTNLYGYVHNDPVNQIDVKGMWEMPTADPFWIMDDIQRRAKDRWPDGFDEQGNPKGNDARWNGPGDAWRHCTGSCEVARQYGETIAEILGDAHEVEGDILNNQELGEHQMDIDNNACGRMVAQRSNSLADCEQGCQEALNNGELKTYEQGTTPTFRQDLTDTLLSYTPYMGTGFSGFPGVGGMGN
jgi:RHS repeat-associated protein